LVSNKTGSVFGQNTLTYRKIYYFLRNIIKILGILTLIFVIYKAIIPKFKFSYYYTKTKSRTLTRVTYPNCWFFINDTYFTPGYYDRHKIPDIYIKPIYSTDGDWAAYVTFHSKGILISATAETRNTSDCFRYFNNSVTYYSEVRKIDSITETFHDVEKIALYSFDK